MLELRDVFIWAFVVCELLATFRVQPVIWGKYAPSVDLAALGLGLLGVALLL